MRLNYSSSSSSIIVQSIIVESMIVVDLLIVGSTINTVVCVVALNRQ